MCCLQKHGIPRTSLFFQTKFTSIDGQDRPQPLPYDPKAPLAEQVGKEERGGWCGWGWVSRGGGAASSGPVTALSGGCWGLLWKPLQGEKMTVPQVYHVKGQCCGRGCLWVWLWMVCGSGSGFCNGGSLRMRA